MKGYAIIPIEELEERIAKWQKTVDTYDKLYAGTSGDHSQRARLKGAIELAQVLLGFPKPKVDIVLDEYQHECGDGCCLNYGTVTSINGEELPIHNQDASTILDQALKHLGFDVNIENKYNGE